MTTIIAKNNTAGDIFLDDLGTTIPASSSVTLTSIFRKKEITNSINLKSNVTNANITINDGSQDLTISEGLNHIKFETDYEDHINPLQDSWSIQNSPPDNPSDGDGWYDATSAILYIFDGLRGKWLSARREWYTFNRSGDITQAFLKIGETVTSQNGFVMPRNATIVGFAGQATSSVGENKGFALLENGQQIFSKTVQVTFCIDTTANLDIQSGSYFSARVNPEASSGANWYDSDWRYRKSITINSGQVSGSTPHENFPLLVKIDNNDLAKARSDGEDIIFVDSSSLIKLDHEIEFFDSTGELIAWVRIPELETDVDRQIDIYYGNSASTGNQNVEGVWNSNYVMVQHMSASSALSQDDSTQNNNDVDTEVGDPSYEQTGKISKAVTFDGSDALLVPDSVSLDIVNEVTLSAWINPTSITSWNRIVAKSHTANENPWTRYGLLFDNATHLRMEISNGTNQYSTNGTTTVQTGQWQYAVATFDGDNITVFYNGNQDGTTPQTTTITTNDMPLSIARSGFDADYFTGSIDEVRVSNVARSPDWISTEYNNQNNPSSFYTLGTEEDRNNILSICTNPILEAEIAWRYDV